MSRDIDLNITKQVRKHSGLHCGLYRAGADPAMVVSRYIGALVRRSRKATRLPAPMLHMYTVVLYNTITYAFSSWVYDFSSAC